MSTLPDAFMAATATKTTGALPPARGMASPYVAGASVLVREAMQDLGYTQITQARSTTSSTARLTRFRLRHERTYDKNQLSRALSTLVAPTILARPSARQLRSAN